MRSIVTSDIKKEPLEFYGTCQVFITVGVERVLWIRIFSPAVQADLAVA